MVPRDVASVLNALRRGTARSSRADEVLVKWLETILVREDCLHEHIRWLQSHESDAPGEPDLDEVTVRRIVTAGIGALSPEFRARLLLSPTLLYGLSERIADEISRQDEAAAEVWVDVLRRLGEEHMAAKQVPMPKFEPPSR